MFTSQFLPNLCKGSALPQDLENTPFLFFYSKNPLPLVYSSILFDEPNQKYAVTICDNLHRIIYSTENRLLKSVHTESGEFYLVDGFFPNCIYKNNVIPLIYDEFFIKLTKVLKDIGFSGTVTDMFRIEEQQISYYKRHWTNSLVSPHMMGLAIDLNNLTLVQERQLKLLADTLGISFLKHGKKYNRHIHLQDNLTWGRVKRNNISVICKKIFQNFTEILQPYKLHNITEQNNSNFLELNLKFETPAVLTIEISRVDGFKMAVIKSGVFGSGFHQLQLYPNFLPSGIYLGRVFINGMFYDEVVINAI